MGKGSAPKDPPPAPPPVASTGVDAGRRAVDNRKKKKRGFGQSDTLLNNTKATGFTAQDLDPRG